jgi:cytochrome o ubiquinol oxidase subunit III
MSADLLTVAARQFAPSESQLTQAEERDQEHAQPTAVLGFWIYLMTDCVLFAALFATYAVLGREFDGGPRGSELFSLPYVLIETLCLLASSFTYGLVMVELNAKKKDGVIGFLLVTFLLGLSFVGLEVKEFIRMISEGAGPDRSAFLSAFFTLVGTHGLHVTAGLIWMAVMFAQVVLRGLSTIVTTRLMCLSLFWHFLDIVWIGVFTIVYLIGSMS